MSKNILIPTDFTIRSLRLVSQALENIPSEEVRITLFHLMDPPSGITDLLFMSEKQVKKQLVHQDFEDACDIIRNKYASAIQHFDIEILFGNSRAFLQNYIDAQAVDCIVYDKKHEYQTPAKRSINPYSLIEKCNCEKIEASTLKSKNKLIPDILHVLSGAMS